MITIGSGALRRLSDRTVAALRVPNFRLYFVGQCVSLVGTWMQGVAQSWLVLQLTHSATLLGLVVAVQFVPVLLGGPYGGLIADRVDKRRLLLVTQSIFAVLALGLGLLTVTHVVRLWMVVLFAVAFGVVNAVDNPTRQSFVPELVGPGMLGNAVSLNSVVVNAARAVGPAVAGLLIATVGVGVCFLVNAASFIAVLGALAMMRSDRLLPVPHTHPAPGQLLEGDPPDLAPRQRLRPSHTPKGATQSRELDPLHRRPTWQSPIECQQRNGSR